MRALMSPLKSAELFDPAKYPTRNIAQFTKWNGATPTEAAGHFDACMGHEALTLMIDSSSAANPMTKKEVCGADATPTSTEPTSASIRR